MSTEGAQVQSQAAEDQASLFGNLEVTVSRRMQPNDFCDLNFEVKNNTQFNFTDLAVDFILRDGPGNIIEKSLFRDRVTPNGNMVADRMLSECSAFASIEFVGLSHTSQIDSEYVKSDLLNLPILSASKIDGVTVKSSAGSLSNNDNGNNAVANEVSTSNSVIDIESCLQNCGDPNSPRSCVSLSMEVEQNCRVAIQACQLKCISQ